MNKLLVAIALCISTQLTLSVASAASDMKFGADRHVSKGIACTMCHADMQKPSAPEMATCTKCHPVDPLVAKTAKVKPTNPHTSPHYGNELECTNCHLMHAPTDNYCAQCHQFDWKVP